MPRFKKRSALKKELGRKGQARTGRIGGISRPTINRKGGNRAN